MYANIFTFVYKRLKTDARKFNFCRLPFAVNVMLKLSNNFTLHERHTARIELYRLPLCNNVKIFAFVVDRRYFSIFSAGSIQGLEENVAVRVCRKRGTKSI